MKNKSFAFIKSLGLLFLSAGPGFAQAPPFSVRNFVYIGKAGTNASTSPLQIYNTFAPSASNGGFATTGIPVTFNPGATVAQGLNGAGINPLDNYLYALQYLNAGPATASAAFYRISGTGQADQVGTITPPTATDAGRAAQYSLINAAAGTIDRNGDYWFSAYSFTDLTPPVTASKLDFYLGKISNLSTLPVTTKDVVPTYYHIDISDTTLQRGFTNYISSAIGFITIGQPFANANGGFQDFDLNPADRKFYSYLAFPSYPTPLFNPYPEAPLSSYLVRIDTLKNNPGFWGKVQVINTTPNMTPNYEADGVWFDDMGNLEVLFTNGQYAAVNTTTGALGPLAATNLPLVNGELRGDLATSAIQVPLPVKLLAFAARQSGPGEVVLRWKVGDAHLLQQTVVERSADGRSFQPLGTLTKSEEENSFTDFAPLSTTAYYRLRMTDVTGKSGLSHVLQLKAGALQAQAATTTAYPNPVGRTLSLRSAAPSVELLLTDLQGRKVLSGTYEGNSTVDLSTLPAGTYNLVVVDKASGQRLLSQLLQKQ